MAIVLRSPLRSLALAGACVGLAFAATRCTSSGSTASGDPCNPDQNGTSGGTSVVNLTVSDTAFAVGSPDSGETNVTVENGDSVVLTFTNVGTKPHDLVISCLQTPNTMGCPSESCFAGDAGIPPVQPGASVTTTIVTPQHEGSYPFYSDVPGDTEANADGGLVGLLGAFNLM